MKKYNDNGGVFGYALPATIYVLVYTIWTMAFSFHLNLNLIRASYAVFYAISIWYFFKSLKYWGSSAFLRSLTFMFSLVMVYCLFLILTGTSGFKREVNPTGYALLYVASVLPIYSFYYFGRKRMLSFYWFMVMTILFCINAYALYYENQQRMLEMLVGESEDFTNNSGYLIVSLLPLMAFFNKRSIIQYVGLFLIMAATILCFKRGAILVGFLAIAYFILKKLNVKNTSRRITTIALVAVLLVLLYRYFDTIFLTNDYFYQRVMQTREGDSGGRDSIYGYFWDFLSSSENGVLGMLFGNGAAGTVKLLGIEAHNDWIEFAIDFGLLGVVVYFLYWLSNYKYYKYLAKDKLSILDEILFAGNAINGFNTFKANHWEFFFEQPFGYTLEEVLKNAKNVIKITCDDCSPRPTDNITFLNSNDKLFWHNFANKYSPIKKELIGFNQ